MKASTALAIFFLVGLSGMGMSAFAQPIGEVDTAGTTWYDLQHPGSCGRMVAIDDLGNVQVVWTKGIDSQGVHRHVFHNVWDTDSQAFVYPEGVQADSSQQAWYVTLAMLTGGCPVPAFWERGAPLGQTVVSLCATTPAEVDTPVGEFTDTYFPQITVGVDQTIHVLYLTGTLYPINIVLYAHGFPVFDGGIPVGVDWQEFDTGYRYQILDTVITVAQTVAASRNGSRVCAGWAKPRDGAFSDTSNENNNDIVLQVTEDGGESWSDRVNVTSFTGPDWFCWYMFHDTLICERDTLRAYTDLSLLFDAQDVLHAAFTVGGYWRFRSGGVFSEKASMIYHWNENTGQFSLVASAWMGSSHQLGTFQRMVQRPSLAIDPATGFLYCAYVRYDTSQYSVDDYLNADIWISVSTNNGSSWSVGVNVTRTTPAEIPAPPGQSINEREPTLAEVVTNGTLHLTYVLDHDAGASANGDGSPTLNEFLYQRIPVDSIPTTPILPNYPLHYDSTGFNAVGERSHAAVVERVMLHPAYPNPFNGTTTIQFDLPFASDVQIVAYDVLGRGVEDILSGQRTAGAHTITWNPDRLASGIYFLVLETPHSVVYRKVMLLK